MVEPAQRNKPLRWGLASADVSTGEVQVMQREESSALHQQLAQQEASELLWAAALDTERPAWCPERLRLTPMASTPFSPAEAEHTLQQHYGLSSLDGLGLPEHPLALQALGGLLRYLQDTQPLEEDSRIPLEVPTIVHLRRCPGAGYPDPPQPRTHRHAARQPVAGVVALGHRSHPYRHGRPLPAPVAGSTVNGPPGHSAAAGSCKQPGG